MNKGHPLHVNFKQTADGAPAFENPTDNNPPSLCREPPVAEQEYPESARRVMYDETPDEQAFLRGSAKPDQDHGGVAFHCLASPGANPLTETSQAAKANDYSHPQKQPLRSSAFEPVGPSPGYPTQPDDPPPNLKPLSLDDYLVQHHSMEDQPLPQAERPRMLGPQPVSPYYTSHGLSPANLPSQPHTETPTTSHREPRHQAQVAPSFGMDSIPPQPHGGTWSIPGEPSGFPASNPGHLRTVAPPAQARRDMPFLSPMDSRGELARPQTPIPTSQGVYLRPSLTPHPPLPADVDFRSPKVDHPVSNALWEPPWPQIPRGNPVSPLPLHRLSFHHEPQGMGLPSQRSGGVSKAYSFHTPAQPPTFISEPPPILNRYPTQHPEVNNSIEPCSHYPFLQSTQDARPLGVRRREKEPAKYDGRSDLVDNLHHFSKIAKRNQWTHEECGLELATSLQGEAREVLRFLQLDTEDDYNTIIQALSTRFDPEGRESRYSAELMERVCQPKEDVATYGHQLQRLAKKAYPGSKLPKRVLVDLFIRGLPSDDMKRHVSSFEPPTYADAVRRATVYEAYSPKVRKPKPDMLIAPIGNSQKSDKSSKNPAQSGSRPPVTSSGPINPGAVNPPGPGPRIPPLMLTPPRFPGPHAVNPQGYSMPPAAGA